jgi:hypothetical protein
MSDLDPGLVVVFGGRPLPVAVNFPPLSSLRGKPGEWRETRAC